VIFEQVESISLTSATGKWCKAILVFYAQNYIC